MSDQKAVIVTRHVLSGSNVRPEGCNRHQACTVWFQCPTRRLYSSLGMYCLALKSDQKAVIVTRRVLSGSNARPEGCNRHQACTVWFKGPARKLNHPQGHALPVARIKLAPFVTLHGIETRESIVHTGPMHRTLHMSSAMGCHAKSMIKLTTKHQFTASNEMSSYIQVRQTEED